MKRNLSHVSNGNVEEDKETLTKRRLINSNDDSTIQEATTLQDSNNGSSSLDNNSNIPNNSNTTINQESNNNNEYIMNILLKKPHFVIRDPIAPPNLELQFWKDLKKTKFQNWTREQVATLLLVDKDHFGCNLSFEQAQEFYCRKVDGKFLEKIANNLKKRSSIQDGAQVFSRYNIDENIKYRVVDWVGSLIRYKFYYIWNETNLQLYMKSNNIKVGINEKKEDVLEKHFKFKKTSINPNFIYCDKEYYFKLMVIRLGVIEFQLKRENFVPSLKSLLNLDHLNSEKIINNECLIKNKILINGSEEEYKLHDLEYSNSRFYSVISPKGNENSKFLTNMASKHPSIIITGNSKDEIMLIEHVLSTFPRDRIYSSAQLLLITKLIYLLKIVESNLLNNLNMNQALVYLANCQLNTDSCQVIMKYFLENKFDLIDSFKNLNSISAKLLLEYLNNLKTKYPTLPNDFVICFDNCDLLE